jgi:hypothetical protein
VRHTDFVYISDAKVRIIKKHRRNTLMANHQTYRSIVEAVKNGELEEPFTAGDIRRVCPQIAQNTPGTFLPKHRRNNPENQSELFEQVGRGQYKLLLPIKYGLDC